MQSLRKAKLVEELFHIDLLLLLIFKLLIDDFLKLLLDFNLHGADLRRNDVPEFVLNCKFPLQVVHNSLHLYEVLGGRSWNLFNRHLFFEVDGFVLIDCLVSQFH